MTTRSNEDSTGALDSPVKDKATEQQIETVPTHDRVPGHTNYYEKGGLRTAGKSLEA